VPRTRGAPPRARSHAAARQAVPVMQFERRTRARLAGSATGSCTRTSAPYERSSLMTSMTRELRRSGQFSLNVSPSTLTSRPSPDSPTGSSA
jgi:hypothetical protein